MTIEANIATALMTKLSQLSLSPAVPVAYPNVSFNPPSNSAWLKADTIGVPTVQSTLGSSGFNRYHGVLQVSVFSPRGIGIVAPTAIAGQVAAHFKRGTVLSHGGVTVRVEAPPSVGTPLQEDAWHQIPVSIRWFADAPNPS